MTQSSPDFSKPTKNLLAARSAYICNNPDCRMLCIGPDPNDDKKIIKVYVAAHISDARPHTHRFDTSMTNEQRSDPKNGIFLCVTCSTLIDKNNGSDFNSELLSKWKQGHLKWVSDNLNKQGFGQGAPTEIHNVDVSDYSQIYAESSSDSVIISHANVEGHSSIVHVQKPKA